MQAREVQLLIAFQYGSAKALNVPKGVECNELNSGFSNKSQARGNFSKALGWFGLDPLSSYILLLVMGMDPLF